MNKYLRYFISNILFAVLIYLAGSKGGGWSNILNFFVGICGFISVLLFIIYILDKEELLNMAREQDTVILCHRFLFEIDTFLTILYTLIMLYYGYIFSGIVFFISSIFLNIILIEAHQNKRR